MRHVRRAHYGAVFGVALIVAALLVTVADKWQDVKFVLGIVLAVLAFLLILKAISIAVIIGLRSVL